jgi:hypothetical protein
MVSWPNCGLVSASASCHCDKQVAAMKFVQSQNLAETKVSLYPRGSRELAEAERQFDSLLRKSDSAALFRAHPEYQLDVGRVELIRSVLIRDGHWQDGKPTVRH